MKFYTQFLLLIIIKLLLEYSYISYVYKVFEYAGFSYDLVISKYLFGWIIYILGVYILYKKSHLYLYEIFVFIFLLYILPNISYYSLSNQSTSTFLTIIIVFYIILLFTTNVNIFHLPTYSKGKPFILILSFLLTIIVVFHYMYTTGGHVVLNLTEVYSFREEFDNASNNGFFGYLNNWVSKIFGILIFAWAISKKKIFLIFFTGSLILALFVYTGHKGNLQGIILVLFFYFLFSKIKNIDTFILISFCVLLLLSILIGFYYTLIPSLIIRRLLFVPAQLNFVYFDFFSQNSFAYWGDSIMKHFVHYPYDTSIANVIGTFMGHPKENANTGFIASGFAQAGYLGVAIYTFVVIIIINIINILAKRIKKYIVMSIIFLTLKVMFISSDLLTTLLTHGLIISILVLWLYSNKEYIIKINNKRYKV